MSDHTASDHTASDATAATDAAGNRAGNRAAATDVGDTATDVGDRPEDGTGDRPEGGTGDGPAGRAGARGGSAAYTAGRTLPLRVEALRQLRRRRTQVAFGFLLALPWVLVLAFKVGGTPEPDGTPSLIDVATESGLNFAAFTLFVSVGFLLVVAVALFCGDTVASEANWASLRYLLAAPVPRARLLRQKLIVGLAYAAAAVICLPLMALVAGTVSFGWDDVRLPSGGAYLPADQALGRMAIVVAYAMISQLVVASMAFLLSVTTDSPLGAVGGAVGMMIVGNILDVVTALGVWREFLPTFWGLAWIGALQPEIQWGGMIKGVAISVSYSIVLLALAFRRFRLKDVVS